ncbi:hypothetical protein WP3S18E05_P13800 (plasmid) [Klebsiella sp. WP3-S18-ESBL-05]|nr:hypothetical protein WP3S18E05_P13800 [Klebsiella sp. WP3-S18-ESBL-05]
MHLIGCFYLILNQGFTDTMQSPHCLLRFRSGLHKTHRRTRCSFTNSFGVDKVVFMALLQIVGGDKLIIPFC